MPDDTLVPLRVRSFVGLIPLLVVEALEPDLLERLPRFRRRMEWFLIYRPHLVANVASLSKTSPHSHHQLAVAGRDTLERLLARMFDPAEFLSDYGLRSLSKYHADHPYNLRMRGQVYSVRYEPAESRTGMFGGNSNWRGPIWFPINSLMIEALRKYHHHYGDSFTVELPRGSGNWVTLDAAADELARCLARVFLRDEAHGGRRPVFGGVEYFHTDPHWRDHVLFYEYFHGDNGAGIGASHQTGWTAVITMLLQQCAGEL